MPRHVEYLNRAHGVAHLADFADVPAIAFPWLTAPRALMDRRVIDEANCSRIFFPQFANPILKGATSSAIADINNPSVRLAGNRAHILGSGRHPLQRNHRPWPFRF